MSKMSSQLALKQHDISKFERGEWEKWYVIII